MALHKTSTQLSSFLSKLILEKSWFLVIISTVVIIIATLYPFDFFLIDNLSLRKIFVSFNNSSSFKDIINNILLFIPLGFSFTALLQKIKIKTINKLFTLMIISAGLSLTVEVLQIFLPSRSPTPADIANNTIGGVVGLTCFYLWHSESFIHILVSLEKSTIKNYTTKIILFSVGYVFLFLLLLMPWQSTTSLSNWDLNYPLLLGNEKTGHRPWQGYISEFKIADKAVEGSKIFAAKNKNYSNIIGDSLIGSYQLTDAKSYLDSNGQLPKFLPQGQPSDIVDSKGVALSSNYWLTTEIPATILSKRIRETSQFTIIATVATADTTQTGPARIISLSANNLHRNFTIGQQGTNLSLRIRTPITGENATDINLSVPEVFTNTNIHYIVITYSQAKLETYIDSLQNYYAFNLLELMPNEQKILCYSLTFVPLSIYLTLLSILAKKKLRVYRFLLFNGIVLPSIVLELILVTYLDKSISITNILGGILLTGSTMLLLRFRASALVRKAVIK